MRNDWVFFDSGDPDTWPTEGAPILLAFRWEGVWHQGIGEGGEGGRIKHYEGSALEEMDWFDKEAFMAWMYMPSPPVIKKVLDDAPADMRPPD